MRFSRSEVKFVAAQGLVIPSAEAGSAQLGGPYERYPSLSVEHAASPMGATGSLTYHFTLHGRLFTTLAFSFASFILVTFVPGSFLRVCLIGGRGSTT